MSARLLMTAGILVFGLLIPILEVNETHLFNPDWPPHARFHDAWQLLTNAGLAALCLWLVWARGQIALAALIGGWIMASVALAHALGDIYEGYATYEGGTELTLLGLPAAVAIPLAAVAMFAAAVAIGRRGMQTE
ncbi:MAG: hypothetical protein CMI62_02435 [Parvibaculum sp.]|jgi:hypothetical protein|uniref:DUF6640 family protein n=1 Tax=Parvibaculum sp. TaxID=2024848 RepID=UPI000C538C71|nr:DUF6640 family protein [Parvibaculum sp.]MAU59569.1 hypothetical protein [Parvibaculum sp.]|tara:strand:- start:3752 stop:4156 length:405 start_codon:yes stop_codon:yes gene_type:complete